MTETELRDEMARIVELHGEWTAERIDLGFGIHTGGFTGRGIRDRLGASVQVMADLAGGTLAGTTILDLGSLEGLFAIEFARHGARVIGVEGRRQNIERARFAARVLGLEGQVEFVESDAVGLDVSKLPPIDFIHCAGLLYHLTADRAFSLLRAIGATARRACVVETCFSLDASELVTWQDAEYYGTTYREFAEGASSDSKTRAAWAALDEDHVFFLTEPSLVSAIRANGFSSVFTVAAPHCRPAANRKMFVGIKGTPQSVLTGDDATKALTETPVPETLNLPYAKPTDLPVRHHFGRLAAAV